MVKVLVADKLSDAGIERLRASSGVEVDVKLGLGEDDLAGTVGDYEGMIVRSGVKVTPKVLAKPGKLRAVARAGVGVDNIDLPSATAAGVLVLNTPEANTLSTAELTMALMLAMARHIPTGDAHVKAGQWKRSQFVGTQLAGKTLGIVGFGRVGRAVAQRALAMEMKVVAYDPFFGADTAMDDKVAITPDLDTLLKQADVLTIHAAKTPETSNMIDAGKLALLPDGAMVINCARGGIINEQALAEAIAGGKLAGAAVDVYSKEPPEGNPLIGVDRVITTPHLGASTEEAQQAVAFEAIDALLGYLLRGEIRNAVNVTGLPAQLSDQDRRVIDLAQRMGLILAPLCGGGINELTITTHGAGLEGIAPAAGRYMLAQLLRPYCQENLNVINVEDVARSRGIKIRRTSDPGSIYFTDVLELTVDARDGRHLIQGTVFHDHLPHVLCLDGYRMDIVPEGEMLVSLNDDIPGTIGVYGTVIGEGGINIADMTHGRKGNMALMFSMVDQPVPDEVIQKLLAIDRIHLARRVSLPPLERPRM